MIASSGFSLLGESPCGGNKTGLTSLMIGGDWNCTLSKLLLSKTICSIPYTTPKPGLEPSPVGTQSTTLTIRPQEPIRPLVTFRLHFPAMIIK